jgi:hypothetical protein
VGRRRRAARRHCGVNKSVRSPSEKTPSHNRGAAPSARPDGWHRAACRGANFCARMACPVSPAGWVTPSARRMGGTVSTARMDGTVSTPHGRHRQHGRMGGTVSTPDGWHRQHAGWVAPSARRMGGTVSTPDGWHRQHRRLGGTAQLVGAQTFAPAWPAPVHGSARCGD